MMKTLLAAVFLTLAALGLYAPVMAQTTLELEKADGTTLSIPLDETQPVNIDPSTGGLAATATSEFSCSGGCEDVQISFDAVDQGFFDVNGGGSTSVIEGGSVTFNWRARGAWTCAGNLRDSSDASVTVNGWSDGIALLPFGSEPVSLSGLDPAVYSASMTCSNGAGNRAFSASVDIEVRPSQLQVPESCEGRQPGSAQASNVCWYGNESVDCFSYDDVFGEFPGSQNSIEFFQDNNTYTTMEFDTTGLTAQSGSWVFETAQFPVGGQGPKLMSLSLCPGDFDQEAIQREMGDFCYVSTSGGGSLRWKRPGVIGARCELQTDQTYYLNILYTTDGEGTPPSELEWNCSGEDTASCGNFMAPAVTQ